MTIEPADLPSPRTWSKRLRFHRHDWIWRLRVRDPMGAARAPVEADPRFPDFAVAAIAISRKYADWCLTMIDTLRRAGDYAGPVYVVTDVPEAFADAANVVTIAVPYSKTRLIAKSCKPLLFRWLTQKYVAYIDADMIVTAPIAGWYRRALKRLGESPSPLLTYRANNPVPAAYHGGLLFAERAAALPFLGSWLAMMRSGRYLSDQVALKRVATPEVPAYYADEAFVYLYRLVDNAYDGPDQPPTFVHITDRMIKDHPSEKLRGYLRDRLGVQRMPAHFG